MTLRTAFLGAGAFALALTGCGCASGDRPLDQVDPDAVPANPSYDLVYSILQRECVPCHNGGGGSDGGGGGYSTAKAGGASSSGGVEPALNRCEEIVANRAGIIQRAVEEGSMPPGAWPRLTSEEKLVIQRWVENGAVAPCY